MLQTIIKLTLSIIPLLLCLLHMPYGYYQFIRFAALVGFAILGYHAYEQGHKIAAIVYVCLALLFQPFLKIALGRTVWNVADVLVATGLLFSIFSKQKKE